MEGSNEIAIDIENQHDSLGMSQELRSLSALSPSRCIYRVPKRLRERKKKAYIPQVVSIGPLHHDGKNLVAMEEHKTRYVKDFLLRNGVSLEGCIQKVKNQEGKLRSCYAEHIEFTKEDTFVRLVLVDALFLIEFLLRHFFKQLHSKNDYIFGTPRMENDLWSDLMMLENQLPFFILEDLWEGAVKTQHPLLFHAYLSFWNQIYSQEADLQTVQMLCNSGSEVKHFVDVIRNLCLAKVTKSGGKLKSIPRTTQLHQAGVKFRVRSTHNLLDIHFANGVLEIPKLKIGDSTETTIRNLVAYEQCHYFEEAYICHYVVLMDDLVNTPKDVELLGDYGILNNMLGDSNQVSTLINNIRKGVIVYDKFYFAADCDRLNAYCKKRWPKWKLNLRQKYLNTPWTAISVGAAILLLMLTITQTLFSIISVV